MSPPAIVTRVLRASETRRSGDQRIERLLRLTPTLAVTSTVAEGRRVMAGAGVPAVPVVDEQGNFAGLFGEPEWLRSLPVSDAETVAEHLDPAPAVGCESTLSDVVAALAHHRTPAVAVLDGPVCSGVITARDVIRVLARTEVPGSAQSAERLGMAVGILTFVVAVVLIVALSV